MDNRFERNRILYGYNYENMTDKKIAIFGLGGVGGYVLEALGRFGIQNFLLVDNDVISITNINRQILATTSTIGQRKTLVAYNRIKDINPNAKIEIVDKFYLAKDDIDISDADFVVDCIDTVSAKLALIVDAKEKNIPIISCMGCGNKLDPSKLAISDISQTTYCPLAKVMRKELKNLGISNVKVLFSTEETVKICVGAEHGRHPPSSSPFVPSVAGLLLANEVIKYFLKEIKNG